MSDKSKKAAKDAAKPLTLARAQEILDEFEATGRVLSKDVKQIKACRAVIQADAKAKVDAKTAPPEDGPREVVARPRNLNL